MDRTNKILICEDNLAIQLFLRRVLEKMNYEVLMDSTGEDAFEIIKNEELRMIITDLNMPSKNGFEIIEYARKKCKKTYPIIVLTNMIFQETEKQAIELGADAFIGKPFDLRSFTSTIESLDNTN